MHRPFTPTGVSFLFSFFLVFASACSSGGSSTGELGIPGPASPGLTVSPLAATTGSVVLVTGEGFSPVATKNKIEFSGNVTALAEVATATTLLIRVPGGAISGPIKISVDAKTYLSPNFTVLPVVTTVSPAKAAVTELFTVFGSGFDSQNLSNNVVLISGDPAVVADVTPSFLTAFVPVGARSGPISVLVDGVEAISSSQLVVPPKIVSFTPLEADAGTIVTIQGFGFSPNPNENDLRFNGTPATVLSSTYFTIVAQVSVGTSSGPITVTVEGETATSLEDLTINLPPLVEGFSPAKGPKGSVVSIFGKNFNGNLLNNTVKFGSYKATVISASSTVLQVVVPSLIPDQTPPLIISVETTKGISTSVDSFVVAFPPVIEDFFPKQAPVGSLVTILGANFYPTPLDNNVTIAGLPVEVLGASLDTITVRSPETPVKGQIQITTPDGAVTSSSLFATNYTRFAYTISSTDSAASFFVFDAATSEFKHNGFVHTGEATATANTGPRSISVHPELPLAYVVNSTPKNVVTYSIGANGALQLNSFPSASTGDTPTPMAIHPSGKFAYVGNQGIIFSTLPSISLYKLEDGVLTAHPAPQVALDGAPISLTFDPAGRYLYALFQSVPGTVQQFAVEQDGNLTSLGAATVGAASAFGGASAILFHPNGKLAYVANSADSTVYLCSVDDGVLSIMKDGAGANISVSTGAQPVALAMDSKQRYLYVANKGETIANHISIFQISSGTGLLSSAGSFTFPAVPGVTNPGVSQLRVVEGKLMAVNSSSTEIFSMQIDEATGQLTTYGRLRGLSGQSSLAIAYGSTYPKISTPAVFVANAGTNGVDTFSLNPDTGALGVLGSTNPLLLSGSLSTGIAVHPTLNFYYMAMLGDPANRVTFLSGDYDFASGVPSAANFPWSATGGANPPTDYYNAKAISVDRSGRFLVALGEKYLVENQPSPDTFPGTTHLLGFLIDPVLGGPLSGPTIPNGIPTAAGKGQSLAFDSTGQYLYVANPVSSNVQKIEFNLFSGAFSSTGTITIANTIPYTVVPHPSGRFVYVAFARGTSTTLTDSVRAYTTNPANGALLTNPAPQEVSLGAAPYTASGTSVAIDPQGRFLFLILNDGTIQSWKIDPLAGTLSAPLNNSIPEVLGNTPHSLAVDGTGRFLLVANSGGTSSGNNIVVCSIQANGALSFLTATVAVPGDQPKGVILNRKVE